MTSPGDEDITQIVTATAGFAYGVIGADLHVFGDGSPLYLLENWRRPAQPDSRALRDQPSRMLNARHAVVDFTGRETELAQLRQWRDDGPRLAVRWLHGPGGQGKSRLAAQFAEESLADGWKVVAAVHGPAAVLAAAREEDLRLTGAAGLLLIVDYADQWPLTHLTWLLSNALLHQLGVPTRVLLLARTLDAWPRVRATLANQQAATSAQALSALDSGTGERRDMFRAARDSFSRHYEVTDPDAIAVPARLDGPELGLVLAVHMAALVAVDAYSRGARPPPHDMAALTAYLLDREHLHWARLHSEETHRIDPSGRTYTTPPDIMNHAVFVAALTGAVERGTGRSLLSSPPIGLDADQTLTDHAVCYPPADPLAASVLEPLYPDRLAEDFLALTLAGHTVDYPAQPWAPSTVAEVLRRVADDTARPWTPRAVTFLATAAGRWPHVGPSCLYPLLRDDPQLAYDAGSVALVALAADDGLDDEVLDALADLLPDGQHVDLDVGAAALTEVMAARRLAETNEPYERAAIFAYLGLRLAYAGRTEEALEPSRTALALFRQLDEEQGPDGIYAYDASIASALNVLGNLLTDLGRHEEGLAAILEAIEINRELAEPVYMISTGVQQLPQLSTNLHNAARICLLLGDPDQALEYVREAVSVDATLAGEVPAYLPSFAESVAMLGSTLSSLGRYAEALFAEEQAAHLLSQLADDDPATHLPSLADVQNNLGITLSKLGRLADALAPMGHAVEIERRLVETNPAAYLPGLANALNNLATRYAELGQFPDALPVAEEAVEIFTRLADANPAAHLDGLARALHNLSSCQISLAMFTKEPERFRAGLETERRAIEIQRKLAEANPAAHRQDLAGQLMALGSKLALGGDHADGLAPSEEAVTIFRELAEADPAAHRAGLALGLTAFAFIRASGGLELRQAHAAYETAFAMWRELVETDEEVHRANFASALLGFVAARTSGGIAAAAALEAVDEAIEIFENILEEQPGNQVQAMAAWGAYHLRADLLDEVGRHAEASDLRLELAEAQRAAQQQFGLNGDS